jgi:hypothetical protein
MPIEDVGHHYNTIHFISKNTREGLDWANVIEKYNSR